MLEHKNRNWRGYAGRDCIRLHGAKRCVSERAAEAFGRVAALVEVVLVEQRVELRMEGLDLRL